MKWFWFLRDPAQAHASLQEAWIAIKPYLLAGHRLEIEIHTERRSSEQNRRMWAMLSEVSRQVEWHGQRLAPSEWKDIFTAGLKRQKVVPGIDGGFVVLGSSTSAMTKQEMSDLMDLMEAFAAQHEVELHAVA